MSRIGNKPIVIPSGVTLTIKDSIVEVKGPKGAFEQVFDSKFIDLKLEGDVLIVSRFNDEKESRARHGLYRSLIANAVEGCHVGFEKKLEIRGVGYRGSVQGQSLELSLGFSHPIKYTVPEGVTVVFEDKSQNFLTVSGIDKNKVGSVAAHIRSYRKPEPYKGKGVRYVDEYVKIKAGKSAASA